MAENRVRIVIEVDGQQAQTVVDALGHRLRTLGDEAQAGTGGARVSLETVTSEAKKTTTAVDETGRKLEEVGPRAQTGAGTAKTALEGAGAEAKKTTTAVDETGRKLEEVGPKAKAGATGAKTAMTSVGAEGKRAAQGVEEAFRILGVRSSAAIRQEMAGVVAAYRRVADSGVASARDQELALARAKERVRELRAELALSSKSMAAPVQSAAMAMGDMAGMLGQLQTIVGGLSLGYVFREAARAAREAIQVVDNYKLAIIGVASTLTDMNKGTAAELRNIYQQNARYAQETYDRVELAAGKFFASSQEMVSAWQILTNKGITLTSDQDINNLGVIVDKIKLMTQGQSSSLQIAQELRAVLSGQARATDQIAMLLRDRLGPEWEAQLNAALEQGRALEFVASQFGGLAAASEDVQNTVTAQMEQQHTLVTQIVRAGFKEMYEDVLGVLKNINDQLVRHKVLLSGAIAATYDWGSETVQVISALGPLLNTVRLLRGQAPISPSQIVQSFEQRRQARQAQADIETAQEEDRRRFGLTTQPVVTNPPKPHQDTKDLPTWDAFRDTLGVSSAETDVARKQAAVNKEINERLATLKEFHRQGKISEQDYQQWMNTLEQARTTRLKDAAAARSGAVAKGLKADMLAAESFAEFYAAKEAYNTETLRGEADTRRRIFEDAYKEIHRIASMGGGPDGALAAIDEAHAFATATHGNQPGFDVWRAGARDEVWKEDLEQRKAAARDYTDFEAAQHALETGSYRDALTRRTEAREAAYKRTAEIDGRALSVRKQALADELAEIEASGRATAEIRAMYAGLAADEDRTFWAERRQNATDFSSAYRAALAEQTALAASGGDEERRIWAELAEQQALLSDEVYASRAEMYDRIVAKAKAAGLDEGRAAALVSRQIDDDRRQRLEFVRDNPTSLGEAMSAAFALESGSYKTAFGRAQDDWRDTTQRMLRLTDDLSSGIAQGFGDAARQGVNHLVEMLGPMGSVFSRILDMVISLLEDIAAEYLRRGIMSLFFDDAQSLAQGLGGISPGGVSGGGGGGIAGAATGVVGDLLTGGISTLFQGGASAVTSGVTSGGFGLGSSLLEGIMGAGVAGVPWAGAATGAAAGAGMGSLVMPIVGTLIGAGLGLLGSLFGGEEEKEEPPQEVWSGRSVMYSGGAMGGVGYTQMSDGSYKLSALDPMELEAERQQFQETVKDINAAAKTLEIDFDRNWDRDFSFFFPPVAEELAGLVERAMYSSAAATVLGELAPAAQLFSEGLEGLHDTLIRLGEAFGAVAGQVEPLGVDFARMGGVTDATLLALASLATGYNAGAALLRQAQEDQIESTEDLTDRFLAAGAAGAEVVRYFQQNRQQLQNLALASYSEQLVDIVGGQDSFDQVVATFAERAYEDRDRTEASINYFSSEFASKLGDATKYFPNFDVSTVLDNPGAFWAAYRAAMEQPMPPSAFEWWADMSGIVSNLQDFQDALADIELGERAWDQNLLARRQIADGQESAAELTQRAVQMEQELADARKNGATFTQQAALAETQAYELERERDRLLGVDDEADSLGEYVDDLKEAVAYQVSAVQSLAASALAASSAFDAARRALRDTVDDMLGLDADPAVTAARAAKEFGDLYRRTMRGDTEAAGQLAAAAEDLWESGRTVYDYDSLRASIVGRLTRAARYTELQDTYQGYAGGMATAQSGLLDYIYDAVSSDTPDAAFMADANSMAAQMQAFVDASTLAAEGQVSAADVAALAREITASMMGTAGVADLLSGTLDVDSLTSDQAKLLLSAYNALQVLGEATDQQYQASAVTLRALDALASETLAPDEWTRVITAIEDGQEEYLDWMERNIEERRAEADRLYALQEQQLEAQETMTRYFAGISGYLLRQTNIETLTDTIADLQSQAGSYQQMAVMAMMAGVPMAAMMQMQQVSAINSQIAALQQELAYWIAYQPSLPQLAEGGIATRRTVAEIAEGRQSEAVVPLDQFWRALERVVAVLERTREEMTALTKEVAGNTAVQATEMRAARLAARSEVPA